MSLLERLLNKIRWKIAARKNPIEEEFGKCIWCQSEAMRINKSFNKYYNTWDLNKQWKTSVNIWIQTDLFEKHLRNKKLSHGWKHRGKFVGTIKGLK